MVSRRFERATLVSLVSLGGKKEHITIYPKIEGHEGSIRSRNSRHSNAPRGELSEGHIGFVLDGANDKAWGGGVNRLRQLCDRTAEAVGCNCVRATSADDAEPGLAYARYCIAGRDTVVYERRRIHQRNAVGVPFKSN
jgi:hypothetical protein